MPAKARVSQLSDLSRATEARSVAQSGETEWLQRVRTAGPTDLQADTGWCATPAQGRWEFDRSPGAPAMDVIDALRKSGIMVCY